MPGLHLQRNRRKSAKQEIYDGRGNFNDGCVASGARLLRRLRCSTLTSTTVVKLPRPSLNFHNRSSILLIYLSHPAVLPVRFYQLIKAPPNQILSNMRPSR